MKLRSKILLGLFAAVMVAAFVFIFREAASVITKFNEIVSSAKVETVVEENNVINENESPLFELDDEAITKSKHSLPKLNEVIGDFVVKNIYEYENREAVVVVFEHNKTGAKAILISNDDDDKSVTLGFNTIAYDDKGIPHVFEHATLGGSEKYKSPTLFFEMTNKTYHTFINALTDQIATLYPLGSLSDTQLFELYKVYIDGVFKPEVLNNKKILDKEAYRYILEDKDDDLMLSGIVYSEMSGVEGNIADVAFDKAAKLLYPGSYVSTNTGGDTKEIVKIEHDEIKKFHETYYHPSNLLITMYGNLDYRKYLTYANDEYLKEYNKKHIDKTDKNYKRKNEYREEVVDFPVSKDDAVEKSSLMIYSIALEDMTQYEAGNFHLVTQVLASNDGPIRKRLIEKLPDATFSIDSVTYVTKPYFNIVFQNVDEKDKAVLKEVVEDSLDEIVTKGFDEDIITGIVNNIELSKELEKDSHGFTDNIHLFYERIYASKDNDILGFFRYEKGIEDIAARYRDGSIKKIINKYLGDNKNSALCMLVPKAGLLEENTEKMQDELKEYKEKLSDDEIATLIEETKNYNSWVEESKKTSDFDKVRAASVSELDEYKANCYAYEENAQGIRYISSNIEDAKYFDLDLLFDTSGVKYEDVLKLTLLGDLLLYLPTKNYPDFKIKAEFSKYAANYGVGTYVNEYYNGGYKPYFCFSILGLNRNLDKNFELLKEVMFNTKFDDIEVFKNCVSERHTAIKYLVNANPMDLVDKMARAKVDEGGRYDIYTKTHGYLEYLNKILDMNDAELKKEMAECESLLESIYNKHGMVCQVISSVEGIKNVKQKVSEVALDIHDRRFTSVSYSEELKKYGDKLAIGTTGNVHYDAIIYKMRDNEIAYSGKNAVIDKILNDKILITEFREKRSAYGAYSETDRVLTKVYTYRDPYLKESYDILYTLPTLIKNLKVTEEELEDYKLSAYSRFAYPLTKRKAAATAINEILSKCNEKRPERYVRYMKEIKSMELGDLDKLSELYEEIVKENNIVAAGNKISIENNKNMFDEIVYDFVN